jgi:hypothetical protein
MAYQTSDTSKIHSTALDAKLVLSNPTEEWTLKNNVSNNNFVLESQTLPNILDIDPITGVIDTIDAIKTTQSKLKSNTAFSTNLLSSLGMVADYDIIFPATPPTTNQSLVFDGVNYVWDVVALAPSPAFIAYHTFDGNTVNYSLLPYNKVHWDTVTQNSTDVTYNAGTDVFTANFTADYQVNYQFWSSSHEASYLAVVRDEVTTNPIVSSLAVPANWAAQVYIGGVPAADYQWFDEASAMARISQVVSLTANQTFTLGMAPDPTAATHFTMYDGILDGDSRPLTFCSIKRLL